MKNALYFSTIAYILLQIPYFFSTKTGILFFDLYSESSDIVSVENTANLSGTYTIGGTSPNYTTITDAVADLTSMGVTGAVTFNIRSGTYNEQISIGEITGVDTLNQVIFQSESGDSSLVVLTFSANSTDNYTLRLDGADWFTFRKMTIEATNINYGRVVEISNESNHNTIENNLLLGVTTTSNSSSMAVMYSTSTYLNENNLFLNNDFREGSYGLYYFGNYNNGNYVSGTKVNNNIFKNQRYKGIYLYYHDAVAVNGNLVTSNSTINGKIGIELTYCSKAVQVTANQIFNFDNGHGIYLSDIYGTVSEPVLLANNFVELGGSNNYSIYGIYTYSGNYQNILYNTVLMTNTTLNSRAFYNLGGSNRVILNNIFVNTGGGYAFYVNDISAITNSDYNDLLTSGPYLGFWNTNQATLPDWQTASSLDANSLSIDPQFLMNGSYQVTEIALNGAASPSPLVSEDIEGEARNATTPDIGADEFTPPPVDAAVTGFSSPMSPFSIGSNPVSVILKNNGTSSLTSVTFDWEINGSIQPPFDWFGSLASGDTTQITIGVSTFNAGISYDLKAWSLIPNFVIDPNPLNDTAEVNNLYTALEGVYTIGGVSPDFNTFTDAVAALEQGGAASAVTFNVRDGIYNEQISIGEIAGTDSLNQVIFQSESSDSTLVVCTYSANSTDNYTLRLDGADWLAFREMTIEATNASFARVVDIANESNHNTFENNVLKSVPATNNSFSLAIVYSDDNLFNEHNHFNNNHFKDGSYGIYYYGHNNNNDYTDGISIVENQFENQYSRGINVYYISDLTILKNVTQPDLNTTSYTAFHVSYINDGAILSNNQILGQTTGYGMFLHDLNGSQTDSCIIANNFVQIGGTNIVRGIYSTSGSYQFYLYNSVHITNTDPISRAFYSSSGDKILLNNIFSNTGGGYAIYADFFHGLTGSDYNDLYTSGPNLGYWSGGKADLAAWVAASSLDSNSISVDPEFFSNIDLHTNRLELNGKGIPFPDVLFDIDGEPRDPVQPDIGADEFDVVQYDAGVASVDSPIMPFAAVDQAIYLTVLNNGLDTIESLVVEWEVNGAMQPSYNWLGTLLSGTQQDSVQIGSFPFERDSMYTIQAWTSLPNGVVDSKTFNDTSSVSNLYAAFDGIYTIGGTAPDYPDFSSALNAITNGGALGPVTFNVRNSTYNEQLIIPEILGVDSTNTLSFQSESGDSSGVILSYGGATSSTNYVVLLDGADWIRFNNLSIQSTNSTYGRVIDLDNEANHNIFEGNEIIGVYTTNTSNSRALVVGLGDNDNYNTFVNNRFIDGSYGLYYTGAGTSNLESGTVIENNRFEEQLRGGIYLTNQNAPIINHNEISSSRDNSSFYGIQVTYGDNGMQIRNNYIYNCPRRRGIYILNSDGTSNERGLIANNFIHLGDGGNDSNYGIHFSNSDYQDVFYNSIHIQSSSSNARVIYITGSNDLVLKNNIFHASNNGYAIHKNSGNNLVSDYNDLFSLGTNFGFWEGTNLASFSDWQNHTAQDSNSLNVDPLYTSVFDLHVSEVDLNNAAVPLPEVSIDIDGEPRSLTTPDIGADEFMPTLTNDVGIDEIIHPISSIPFPVGNQNVEVVLKNNGADTIYTALVRWEVNGVVQANYSWSDTLLPGSRDTVPIGLYDFQLGVEHEILSYTENPNGMPDSLPFNDSTLVVGLYPGLDGIYTLGGSSPDFTNFTETATNLIEGGVLGSVTFNVRNGAYNERLSLPEIKGASAINTILFQSESGDSTSVQLNHPGFGEKYVIQLDGADYLTFSDLTIQSQFTNFDDLIYLENEANYNQFLNNSIKNVSGSGELIHSTSDNLNQYNEFKNNHLQGGAYAFFCYGQGNSTLESGTVIQNNLIENQTEAGIWLYYQDAPQILENSINGNNGNSGYDGIYVRYCHNGIKVLKNKIAHAQTYGLLLNNCNASGSSPALIANNFVHVEGTNTSYGISAHGGSYLDIYHNNVQMTNSSPFSRSFYAYYGSNINLKNNVFSNIGGGYAAYFNSTQSLSSSDFNDFYATGTNLAYWAGTTLTDLAAFQSASGTDINSVSVNPLFTSNIDLHISQVQLDSAAMVLATITDDIDGEPRDLTHPDIGADEIAFLADDVGIIALIEPQSDCNLGLTETISVRIQNYSAIDLSGFDIAYNLNGGAQVLENVGALIVPAGSTADYAFATTGNLSNLGSHELNAYTLFSADANNLNDTLITILENAAPPGAISNMVPVGGAVDVPINISFSWSPASGAVTYDLYLWLNGSTPPATPTAADITTINYFFNGSNSLTYGETYDWQVVSKNDYCETPGPIQSLTIQDLPDLIVDTILAPPNAFSGQIMDVTWEVKNMGLGNTGMTQWKDFVYLSDDAVLDLNLDTYLGNVFNFSALSGNQSYSNTASFMLPEGLSGTYYVFIWTDRYDYLNEGDENNNSGSTIPFMINLTPPPDLQVTSIITPNNIFSNSDINVAWTVTNEGTGDTRSGSWWDRVYFSSDTTFNQSNATYLGQKRFDGILEVDSSYTQNLTGTIPQGISGDYYIHVLTDYFNYEYEHVFEQNNTSRSSVINVILTPPPDLIITDIIIPDSASNKESIFVEWTVENQGGSIAEGNWRDYIYISTVPDLTSLGSATFLTIQARPNDLNPLESYTTGRTVIIPDHITGPYFFYIHTDKEDKVYEYTFNDNNITRSDDSLLVQTPDMEVANIMAPDTSFSGDTIQVNWTVKNIGNGKVDNRPWSDRIYIAPTFTYNPDSASTLGNVGGYTTLLAGDSLNRQLDVILPNGIVGQYYIFIKTDRSNSIYEDGFETNNINDPGRLIEVGLSPFVDLNPISINTPVSANAGDNIAVNFTVKNIGTLDAQGLNWRDKIYLSTSSVWNSSNAQLLLIEQISQGLGIDSSYTINATLNLPLSLATDTYYLFLATDQEDDVYEYTQEDNNRIVSSAINIASYPQVDLKVIEASAPNAVASGQSIGVEWTVENQSSAPTIVSYWFDAIYLSADTVLDVNVDQLLGTYQQNGPLAPAATYTMNQSVTIPLSTSGTFYLIVKTDYSEINDDANVFNNKKVIADMMGNQQTLVVGLTPPPDLVVTSLSYPALGTSGQAINVTWTVQNNGTGSTSNGAWSDRIYLSSDFNLSNDDQVIATRTHTGDLTVGASYTDSTQANIPVNVSGNKILLVKTDYNNTVFEDTGEDNNVTSALINIVQPPPSDLVVTNVVVPTSAMAGKEVSIEWTIKNEGLNPAAGSMKEAVYFSTDTQWDVGDALLDVLHCDVDLSPAATQIRSMMADLTGVNVADYYVIVRTDILNNIYEGDDDNNLKVSDLPVSIEVPELLIDVLTPDTLGDDMELYYRIEIPAGLEGESLLVTLKGDSINGNNELYLRKGIVPTRILYDFAHDVPFFGNQEVIIPELQVGTIYLMAYGNTSNGNVQDITLLAEILDFEIRSINATKGGNSGQITLELEGSKFDSTMVLRLENASTTITAQSLLYIDPLKVFATFDLTDQTLGMYNLIAEKVTTDTASLTNAFEIITGLAPNLVTNVVQPANTGPGQTISIKVDYTNTGNTDLFNPMLNFKSLESAPISLTLDGLNNELTELTLSLEEVGGPPGVLRPGAVGSITVYTKSTKALGFLLTTPGF